MKSNSKYASLESLRSDPYGQGGVSSTEHTLNYLSGGGSSMELNRPSRGAGVVNSISFHDFLN